MHDFGEEDSPERAKEFLKHWEGFETICPFVNEDEGDELVLEGTMLSKHSSNHKFQIKRCNSTKRALQGLSECYDDHVIDNYVKTLQIDSWVVEEKFDYDQYENKPIFLNQRLVSSDLLDPSWTKNKVVSLKMNTIKLRDYIFQFGVDSYYGSFFNLDKIIDKYTISLLSPNTFYTAVSYLIDEADMHERTRYGFFDLLGDLGGVKELIAISFGIFLTPISHFSFTVDLASRLFRARTKDGELFKN